MDFPQRTRRRLALWIAGLAVIAGAALYVVPALAWAQGRWTADQALEAFLASGLEVSDVLPIAEDPHPELPAPAGEGQSFSIWDAVLCMCTGYGPGVQVMHFSSRRELAQALAYYRDQLAISGYEYTLLFSLDNLIVVATPDIPPDLFGQYEVALRAARG